MAMGASHCIEEEILAAIVHSPPLAAVLFQRLVFVDVPGHFEQNQS